MLQNVICFQLSQAMRDYRLMKCVDSSLYTEDNKEEVLQLFAEMCELDQKYQDNKGRTLKQTQQTDEGKCLTSHK